MARRTDLSQFGIDIDRLTRTDNASCASWKVSRFRPGGADGEGEEQEKRMRKKRPKVEITTNFFEKDDVRVANLMGLAEEAINTPFCRLREKFHAFVLRSLRIS